MTPRSPLSLALWVVGITALLTALAVPALRATLHYPTLAVSVAPGLRMGFSSYGATSRDDCEASLERQAAALRQNCPACVLEERRCLGAPPASFFAALSQAPLDTPSARYADGVIVYSSAVPELALAVCRESERQTALAPPDKRMRCFAPGMPRPRDGAS